jgi:chromosome partitioning protein
MRTLAIALQAGGVGKTTLSLNLGALLADRGRRVLLVDLDGQRNLTDAFEVTYDPAKTVFEALTTDLPASAAIAPIAGRENFWILPGSERMARFDVAIATEDQREYRLRETLEPLRDSYDYVLLDCPPGLGLVLINALIASDEVLVPVQTRQRRVNALPVFLRVLVRAQKINPKLRLAGIVPNQFDGRNAHDRDALGYIQRFAAKYGFPVFEPIRTSTRIPEAEAKKLPLCDYDRTTPAAGALEDLAERLDTGASVSANVAADVA